MVNAVYTAFPNAQVGDVVLRNFCSDLGDFPMPLKVTSITPSKIICGDWEFCRTTGAEIDDVLGWGPPPKPTGSYLS